MAAHWISKAIRHPGALRAELHVKAGEKIPAKKLAAAAKKGGVEGRRARLAETLKHMHHGGDHKATHGLHPEFTHGGEKGMHEARAQGGDGRHEHIQSALEEHWGK